MPPYTLALRLVALPVWLSPQRPPLIAIRCLPCHTFAAVCFQAHRAFCSGALLRSVNQGQAREGMRFSSATELVIHPVCLTFGVGWQSDDMCGLPASGYSFDPPNLHSAIMTGLVRHLARLPLGLLGGELKRFAALYDMRGEASTCCARVAPSIVQCGPHARSSCRGEELTVEALCSVPCVPGSHAAPRDELHHARRRRASCIRMTLAATTRRALSARHRGVAQTRASRSSCMVTWASRSTARLSHQGELLNHPSVA